jgi:predicted dehydrogenase
MRLKVAVVGCGKIADGHVEEIQKLENATLVGVCDIEPLMAEQMAVRYGIGGCYSDFDQMLAELKPDVVHITTPPQSHLLLASKAVAAGCHVYVEKPLAMDLADARALIELVERAGKKMTINYWPNFDAPGLALRSLLNEGVLGDIVHVESYLGYNLDGAFGQALLADPSHWVHRLPGKLFQNNLDHVLNKIAPFLGDVTPDIRATAYRRRKSVTFNSTDEMPDELRVSIHAGDVSAYATFCSHARPVAHFLRVYGTRNTAHLDYNLRMVTLEPDQKLPSALGRLLPPFQHAMAFFRQGRRNVSDFLRLRAHYFSGMNLLISEFYESILHDKPVPIAYQQILLVSELIEAINSQIFAEVVS